MVMIIHVVNELSRDVRPGSRGGYMRLVILENVWHCFDWIFLEDFSCSQWYANAAKRTVVAVAIVRKGGIIR